MKREREMSTKWRADDRRNIISRSDSNMNTSSLILHHHQPSVISSFATNHLCTLPSLHMHLVDDSHQAALKEALRLVLQDQQPEAVVASSSRAEPGASIKSAEWAARRRQVPNSIQEQLRDARNLDKPNKLKAATYTGNGHSYSAHGYSRPAKGAGWYQHQHSKSSGASGWCSDDDDDYDSDFADSDAEDDFGEHCYHKQGLKKIYVEKYVEPKHDKSLGADKHSHTAGNYYSEPHYGGKVSVRFRLGGSKGGLSYGPHKKGPVTQAYVYVLQPVKLSKFGRKSNRKPGSPLAGYKSGGGKKGGRRRKYRAKKPHHHHNPYDDKSSYGHEEEGYDKASYHPGWHHKSGHKPPGGYKSFNGQQPRMNVAGILGYTLFCINYLLLMQQQPHSSPKKYHHSNSAGDHYAGAASGLSAPSGPVMLAHCGELPGAPPPAYHHKHHHHHHPLMKMHSSKSSSKQPVADKLESAATEVLAANVTSQRAEAPPTTGANEAANSNGTAVGVAGRAGITLFGGGVFPAVLDNPVQDVEPGSFELVARGRFRRPPLSTRLELERLHRTGERTRLVVSRQREPLLDGRLVLVRSRESLPRNLQLRERPVRVSLRVVSSTRRGSSYVIARNLPVEEPPSRIIVTSLSGERQTAASNNSSQQLASKPERELELMQADQPASGPQANNNQLIDLPELALEGDSIELSCAHGMAMDRLYSMKWFKDSLEFYRFIPANGPAAAKRSLRLPDVRVDLPRSTATSVYLRNVTHRTGGHFRCEAISEGPNFETLSGEKRMQVYTLPKSGPKLSINELPADEPRDPFVFEPRLFASGLSLPLARHTPTERGGPLISCSSEPASPAAYLRILVNDRPLDPRRLLSNVTRSYPELDELEVNQVAFRLRLEDFVIPARGMPAGSWRPNNEQPATASRLQEPASENSNARVQFDDQLPAPLVSSTSKQPTTNEVLKSARHKRRQAGAPPLPVREQHEPASAEGEVASANINAAAALPGGGSVDGKPSATGQSRDRQYSGDSLARGRRQTDGAAGSRIYSNNIKIKCTSLVPAIGYDMTAEVNASLTLLVPAAYLTDATGALASSGGQQPARGGPQVGRAVIGEPRMAQASAPPANILLAPSGGPRAPPTNGTSSRPPDTTTKGSSSPSTGTSTSTNNNSSNGKRARIRTGTGPAPTPADTERSKRLQKLSSNAKSPGKYREKGREK